MIPVFDRFLNGAIRLVRMGAIAELAIQDLAGDIDIVGVQLVRFNIPDGN